MERIAEYIGDMESHVAMSQSSRALRSIYSERFWKQALASLGYGRSTVHSVGRDRRRSQHQYQQQQQQHVERDGDQSSLEEEVEEENEGWTYHSLALAIASHLRGCPTCAHLTAPYTRYRGVEDVSSKMTHCTTFSKLGEPSFHLLSNGKLRMYGTIGHRMLAALHHIPYIENPCAFISSFTCETRNRTDPHYDSLISRRRRHLTASRHLEWKRNGAIRRASVDERQSSPTSEASRCSASAGRVRISIRAA